MNESEFLEAAERELNLLQDRIEARFDDVDGMLSGHVLRFELENGAEMVVNIQAPMQEIWLASRRGGYHFALSEGEWRETRTGESLEAFAETVLSALR